MKLVLMIMLLCYSFATIAQPRKPATKSKLKSTIKKQAGTRDAKPILPGAYSTTEYFPMLKEKRVAVFANHTSTIGQVHLVDTMVRSGIKVIKIFAPEHGFRGTADAGEKIDSYTDRKTGIPVISLYGKKRKPTAEDLEDVDVMLFDIQDVGVRFYTFISSLQDYMEAAIEHKKQLIILDRPNPNGHYVDGPVLDMDYKSFVGMQAVPVVYGMTIGEYANMLVGEGLFDKNIMANMMMLMLDNNLNKGIEDGAPPKITVIKNRNYTHKSRYVLPVKPSPNLPDEKSIYWYPSTCLFEGTALSEGRGTDHPFVIFGHPSLPKTMYSFTPTSREGAKNPKFENKQCYGWNLKDAPMNFTSFNTINLKYLLEAYRLFPDKENFFITAKKQNPHPADYFFNKLAGNAELMQQIKDGKTEAEIRASWQPMLDAFKKKRKRYLMYPE